MVVKLWSGCSSFDEFGHEIAQPTNLIFLLCEKLEHPDHNFIHSVKRNALTLARVENLVFVHSNLRHLSRRTESYKTGETKMWDVRGDSFESLSGVEILEVANLSLDEPELQSVSFEDVDIENVDEA
jgi:hypothetical protein